MIVLNLTFLAPAVLAVQLAATAPILQLRFQAPQRLAVELVQTTPTLRLDIRPPLQLDAALLPVLIGPPGPAGDAAPKSPEFTWVAGQLVRVTYADGSTKDLTWSAGQLTQVDFARTGYPATRKLLTYNPDGTLAAVAESVI